MTAAPLMQFARPPAFAWQPLPGPRQRINRCGLCRCRSPALFDVPTDVWLHYVGIEQRHQIVCIPCWNRLTEAVDGYAYQTEHGGPLPLWSPGWRIRHGIPPNEPCPMPAEILRRFTIPAGEVA